MIRSSVMRAFPKPLSNISAAATRPALQTNAFKAQLAAHSRVRASVTPLAKAVGNRRAFATSLARFEKRTQDIKEESAHSKEKLEAHPELVSASSSVRPVAGEVGAADPDADVDMMKTIRHDVVSH